MIAYPSGGPQPRPQAMVLSSLSPAGCPLKMTSADLPMTPEAWEADLPSLSARLRTADGSRYLLNYGKLASVLGDPIVEIDAGTIAAEINRARHARKRAYARGA